MTRTLAIYIAMGYMVEKENPALEQARQISFDEIDRLLLEEASAAPQENKEGSYERILAMMGRGLHR